MLPSQDMQYLATDIPSLSSQQEVRRYTCKENTSLLMDPRCKSDLNVMVVYWCRLFNASSKVSIYKFCWLAYWHLNMTIRVICSYSPEFSCFGLDDPSAPVQVRLSLAESGPELLMKITLLQSRDPGQRGGEQNVQMTRTDNEESWANIAHMRSQD